MLPILRFSVAVEQIRTRIDDKLSRITNRGDGVEPDEDTVLDLIGYLVLLRVAQQEAQGER